MKEPQISVIIPSYNNARYLREAIHSVIDQHYSRLQIIVVDDGSTDDTASVAERCPGIHYLYQENAGAAAARNAGLQLAQGELLAFLDADDLWVPGKISRQLCAFAAAPDVDMIFGHVEEFLSPEIDPAAVAQPRQYVPGYVFGSILIKAESLFKVGPLSSQWRVGEFVDWYTRAQELGLKSVAVKEVLLRRRLHSSNLGIRKRDARTDYAAVIKAALDRRRQAGANSTTS